MAITPPEYGPDAPASSISPASDVWSLGCVYLEFIIWYLEDTEAVHVDFPNDRIAEGYDQSFYHGPSPGPAHEVGIKPCVYEASHVKCVGFDACDFQRAPKSTLLNIDAAPSVD